MLSFVRRRLAAKLAVGYLVAAACVTGSVGGLLLHAMRARTLSQLRASLSTQARLIAETVQGLPADEPSRVDLQQKVGRWREMTGVRITVISLDGRVVADSEVPWERIPDVENHGGRPEVRAALRGEVGSSVRTSATVGHPLFYVAVPLRRDGTVAGVLRIALPLEEVRAFWWTVGGIVALGLGLTALLIMGVSSLLALRVTRPLREIAQSADRFAAGDLAARASVRSLDEVADLARVFNSVADQLQARMTELESSRSQIEGILQSMTEGVLVVAPDERLLLVNRSARQILDLAAEAGSGTSLMEAIRQPELDDLIRRVLRTGRPEVKDLALYAPVERDLEVRAAPCDVCPSGRCALLVFRDVTELRRLERLRTQFVANVSHELKTPLTTIQGAAETLLDGAADDPKGRGAFLAAIREESDRLRRLVEDLLALASVESRQAGPAREAVDTDAFLSETLSRYQPLARQRQITLTLEAGAALPPVRADRDHLAQAVGNLLDNAIKYNHPGGKVFLRARRDADALAIEVEDTGIGIPPEDLPRVFERFYRVDKARSRETGGTGLGLSIVKHVAEAHDGAVSVESRPGQGSRFTLKLPL